MDMFLKSDLQTGMLVETLDTWIRAGVVMLNTANGDIIVGDGWQSLSCYDMDRVVKVSVPKNNRDYASLTSFYKNEVAGENEYTVIWAKPVKIEYTEMTVEDVERLVGTRVKIVGDK